MVAEMMALAAAAAMATVIIEPEKWCMMVSFCSESVFSRRITFTTKVRGVVLVAALGLRKGEVYALAPRAATPP